MNLPKELADVLQFAAAINSQNRNHQFDARNTTGAIQPIDPKKLLSELTHAAQQGSLIEQNAVAPPPQAVSSAIRDAGGNIIAPANQIAIAPTNASPLTQEMIIQFLQVLDGISQKLSNIQDLLTPAQSNN